MTLWDDVEGLRTTSQVLMWLVLVFSVLAAASTGLRYFVDRQVGKLSSDAQRARDAEVQDRLRGRQLSAEQMSVISNAARDSCKVLGFVHVTAANSNNEAQIYGSQFVRALQLAGCEAGLSLPIPGLRPDVIGVFVAIRDQASPGAQELIRILTLGKVAFTRAPLLPDFFQGTPFILVIGGRSPA